MGVSRSGAQHVLPVQAKGGRDRLGRVQLEQDIDCCAVRFPDLICRPIGAQFMSGDSIAMFELTVVDDDVGGPYPASPSTHVAAALVGRTGTGGSRVVLAFCEPRGWKGRAGFGEATRAELARHAPGADLVILFGHPRLLADIPGQAPVLLAWHRQRPLQEAAARRLEALAG